jgi:hypothetical protein
VTVSRLPAARSSQVGGLPQLVPNPGAYAAAKAAVNPNAGTAGDSGAADDGPSPDTVTLGSVLPSPLSINPPNPCGCTPPDMALGVGDGYKMEQVNTEGQIWNSSNTVVSTFTLAGFYVNGSDFISDPWVFFDKATNRWFAGIFDVTTDSESINVSQTNNPTGLWFVYHITNPASAQGTCPDQGKGGVSDNIVALSTNLYTNCSNSGSYVGAELSMYPKAAMEAGTSFTYNASGAFGQYFSMIPAQSMSATTTQQFVGVDFGTATAAHRVIVTGTPPSASIAFPADVPIHTLNIPPNAVQKGTGTLIDSGDDRVQEVAWQSNSLIFTATDACVPNKDTVTRACARVIAINTSTGAKTIDKDRSNKGKYYFYPAPRPDPAGTIVVSVGRSSSALFPELDLFTSSPSGKLSKAFVVKAGTAPDVTGRHGDYFAAAIDPASPTSAWVSGGIGDPSGWSTAVGNATVTP